MRDNFELSTFFRENEVPTSDDKIYSLETDHPEAIASGVYTISEYISAKHIRQPVLQMGDRTICGMLRNVNLMSHYTYENKIAKIIVFINNAVLQLRKYKIDFDSGWWNNRSSVKEMSRTYARSKFEGEKLELAKALIETKEHTSYTNLKILYDEIDNDNIRKFLLECAYYTYRINNKLLEYELKLEQGNG